jgi:hypothetical protein
MYDVPMIGIRPSYAEIWSANQPRTCQVLLPPKTRPELAERAVQKAVQGWVEALDTKYHLELVSDVEITGPHLYPFLDHFGDDLYLATGRFRSRRPRLVPEDLVVAHWELADELADIEYVDAEGTTRNMGAVRCDPAPPSLPDDAEQQLAFVAENADRVYDDLREQERMADDARKDADEGIEELIARARAAD